MVMNVYFAKRLERIDGLINQNDLESFKQLAKTISDDIENDGFNPIDVKVYLQQVLEELLKYDVDKNYKL